MSKKSEKEFLAYQIIKSKNKKIIFSIIKDKSNFMQTDIFPFIKNRSHLSRSIKEMQILNLIICKNPENKNYKLYETTSKIQEIREEVEKYSQD